MATDYGSFEWPPTGGGGGVTSLDGITGAVVLIAGTGISITDNSPVAGDITIASTSAGDVTIGAFGSTPNANGLSINGSQVLNMQPADGTHPGGVSTAAQTLAGLKSFSSGIQTDLINNLTPVKVFDLHLFQAFDSSGSVLSIDWNSRFMYDTSGAKTVDYNLHLLYDGASVIATDWTSRLLKNGAGNEVLSWSALQAKDAGGFVSYNWNNRTLNNTAGSTILSWGSAINIPGLTASQAVFTDSSKNLVSNAITGSGNVVMSSGPTMTNPIVGTQATSDNSTKAASTAYVTTAIANAVAGVNPAVAVQAATTAAGDTSGFTYNNGVSGIGATFTGSVNTAVTIDGYTFTALGQRLLVKNDTQSPSGAFNGIYYVTQLQTGLLAPILTRALDYDTPSDINNTGAIPVINGTVNGTTSWVETALVNTVGTDPLSFTKFTRNPADYLLVANNLSDVASKTTSFNNLSPMTTSGDIIYGGASGAGTRLAANSTGTNKYLQSVSSGTPSWQQIAFGDISGTLGIASGGTGQTSKAAAFDALQPMTTGGDLIYGGASGTGTRLANGSAGQVLTSAGGTSAPTWAATSTPSFSANTSTTAATTSSPFVYTSVDSDSDSAYSASTGVFTIPTGKGGVYFFGASVYVGSTGVTLYIRKNGSNIAQGVPVTGSANGSAVTHIFTCAPGDTIDCRPDANATASGGALLNRFYGYRLHP